MCLTSWQHLFYGFLSSAFKYFLLVSALYTPWFSPCLFTALSYPPSLVLPPLSLHLPKSWCFSEASLSFLLCTWCTCFPRSSLVMLFYYCWHPDSSRVNGLSSPFWTLKLNSEATTQSSCCYFVWSLMYFKSLAWRSVFFCCLCQCFIAVKIHHDHSNSYGRKHLIRASLQVQSKV